MIRFEHNGQSGTITFQRPTNSEIRKTICTIEVNDPENYHVRGEVNCFVKDRYVKEIGRRESLKRAITVGEFDRATRTAIWNAYWSR